MELNLEIKQQLDKLMAKPSLATSNDIPFLQNLIATYPFYQPLHLLLAKASNGSAAQQAALTKAALYNNGSILHRVINEPQLLSDAHEVNVIVYQPWNKNLKVDILTAGSFSEDNFQTASQNFKDEPIIENIDPLPNEILTKEPSWNIEKAPVASNFVVPEIENLDPLKEEVIDVCEPRAQLEAENYSLETADDQETFEEITELVVPTIMAQEEPSQSLEEVSKTIDLEEPTKEQQQAKNELVEELKPAKTLEETTEQATEISTEKIASLEAETFATANFFAFDTNFSSEKIEHENGFESSATLTAESSPATFAKENTVSKYDDDKLPFTFLWWLAKTRKDHEQIFRPFVSAAKTNVQVQDLQQQYVENIFHIQAPFEPEKEVSAHVAQPLKPTKESEIIDTFIKNDPQIKALPPNQINNENKAKRSAEDSNDLVSETLAQIYIEQMLYHKAIDTYQKLSLKFPEKSGYFADLIQSLEKKI